MTPNQSKFIALAIVPAALLASTSCSTDGAAGTAHHEGSTLAAYQEGVPGGVTIDTYKITATVDAVDREKRQVTFVTPDGKKRQYKAGPDVINFDQILIGDRVKATVTQQLVTYVREKGDTRRDGQVSLVALDPKRAKSGVLTADTVEVTTQVKSVDLEHHQATLEFPDGSTRTVAVRPDVKLSATDVGREVVIQVTQDVAVRVEKP